MRLSPRACLPSPRDPKVLVYDFVQFLVPLCGAIAPDGEDTFHLGIEQTSAQDALSDHARRPEMNHLHV
jgi:hypothetical protein